MKVTQEMLEDKIVEKIMNDKKDPKFIFLDTKSYQELADSFHPKEKVETSSKKANLKRFVSSASVEIFEVNTEKDLFEII